MALAMIEGAERDGLIAPGTTVVEYTGGSTGPALALVCRAKGYRARIVISDCFSEERMQLMRAPRRADAYRLCSGVPAAFGRVGESTAERSNRWSAV